MEHVTQLQHVTDDITLIAAKANHFRAVPAMFPRPTIGALSSSETVDLRAEFATSPHLAFIKEQKLPHRYIALEQLLSIGRSHYSPATQPANVLAGCRISPALPLHYDV